MFVGGSGGEGCLHPFSPRLPGLLPSPVPKDGEGEASSRARILPSARGGDPGLTRTCAPCSSGDAALGRERRRAQGGPPSLPEEGCGGRRVLGRRSDGRAPGGAGSARCVRRLDGSLVPAIRITYRVSLRSSSSREPRYPSTGVVSGFRFSRPRSTRASIGSEERRRGGRQNLSPLSSFSLRLSVAHPALTRFP